MQKLLIIAFLVLIVWNLGAGLYYMMVDKGTTNRTVKSLSWRIGLSLALIALVILGIASGVIQPHGVGRSPV
jgi:putative copper export protein